MPGSPQFELVENGGNSDVHGYIKPDTIGRGGLLGLRTGAFLTIHEAGAAAPIRTRNGRPTVELLGCPVDALDMRATVARCLQLIEDGKGARHVCVNAAKLVAATEDARIADYIRQSDVVSADGQSVVWAARALGHPIPERVPGIDLMSRLLAEAETRGLSVYLLGATDEVLRQAEERLHELYPRLRLAGSHNGYFSLADEPQVAAEIGACSPDILFVAMSSPRKEEFLSRNLNRLDVPFAMGVGGALEVIAGVRSRAPEWMQRAGLEWLHRTRQEPARLWRRYLVGNLRFCWLIAREALVGRKRWYVRAG